MNKKITFLGILLLLIISISLVYAQDTGEGGGTAPIPSNGSSGGGGVANITLPYIDPEILEEFNKTSEISIIVKVRDTTNIVITQEDAIEEQTIKDIRKKEILENKTNSTLTTLSDSEFKLEGKFLRGDGFYGRITKKGFDILINNPNVGEIYLERIAHTTPVINADKAKVKKEEFELTKNESTPKNLSEIEEESKVINDKTKIPLKTKDIFWILTFIVTLFIIIYLTIRFKKGKHNE